MKKLVSILIVIMLVCTVIMPQVSGAVLNDFDVEIIEPIEEKSESAGLIGEENGVKIYKITLLHEGGFPKDKGLSTLLFAQNDIIKNALFEKSAEIKINTNEDAEKIADLYEWVVNAEPELFYVTDIVKIMMFRKMF